MVARYDCVVVGGGPAGATAARILARKGWNILLVDKAAFPRDKPCGGLVSGLFQEFPYLKPYKDELVVTRNMSYWITLSNHKRKFTFSNEAYTILRTRFDNCLINLAKDNGVELWEQSRVSNFGWRDEKKSEWNITIKTNKVENVRASLMIGADGVLGKTRRLSRLKSRWMPNEVGLCLSAEYPLSEKIIEDHYGFEKTVSAFPAVGGMTGYGWVFPKRDTVNIGLGGVLSSTKHIRDLYQRYMLMLKKRGIVPPNIDRVDIKPRSHLIPLSGPIKKTYGRGLLLVGDTGGFVNPLTGAGIMPGMHTGYLAAQAADTSLRLDDSSPRILHEYEKKWKRNMQKKMKLDYVMQRLGSAIISNPLFQIFAFQDRKNKWI